MSKHAYLPEKWTQEECEAYAAKQALDSWTHGVPPREAGRLDPEALPVIEQHDPPVVEAEPDPEEDLADLVAAIRKAETLEDLKLAMEDAWILRRARSTGEHPAELATRLDVKAEARRTKE